MSYPDEWGAPLTGSAAADAFASLVSEASPVYAIGTRMTGGPGDAFEVELVHHKFHGMRFTVTLDRDGSLTAFRSAQTLPGQVLSTRLLRQVPVGELHSFAVGQIKERVSRFRSSQTWADGFVDKRPGRRGRDDRSYAEIAAAYSERLQALSSTPIRDLAEASSYSASQIRNLLHEARRRGLLTSTPNGRAGGELTSKALQLLREDV